VFHISADGRDPGDQKVLPFVADGHQRARDGIRAKVEKKYARRLKTATPEARKILLKRIEAEVRAMIQQKAPPRGLY
jgi:hypothetical protein